MHSMNGIRLLAAVAVTFFGHAGTVPASVFDLEFDVVELPVPDAGHWRESAVGDVDGDGTNEVVVSTAAGNLFVFSVDTTGHLTIREIIRLPGGRPGASQWISPQIADVDKDGDMDLVTWWRANNTQGVLDVAYKEPAGYTVVSYPTPDTDAGYRMAFADFDRDGLGDVMTVNLGFSAPLRLFVLYNHPDPALRYTAFNEFEFPGARLATAPFTADVDGDGLIDVGVTTHHAGPLGLRLLFGDLEHIDLDPGDGTRSQHVAFGDVGTDGVLDIVTNATIPHSGTNYLWLYEQLPGRAFTSPEKLFTSGQRPKMLTFADFDGDGSEELVVSVTGNRDLDFFGRDASGRISGPPRTFSHPLIRSVDHGFGTIPNVLTVGDVDNDGDLDILVGGDGTIFVRNRTNQPPVALCRDIEAIADDRCLAEASVDAGSHDPDGDSISLVSLPSPPYGLGETEVTLRVSDGRVESQCTGIVRVRDETAPVISCHSPSHILPRDVPISWSASATDNCSSTNVHVESYDCYRLTRNGKRIHGSCVVEITGSTVTVLGSGGVGNHVEWTVVAQDAAGNLSSTTCEIEVLNPGHN